MQKKFVLNLFLLLFLNLLIKPFWMLGVDRAVQNTVGPAEYGIYFTLFNFSFLFNIFLDVGITNFNNKNIAQNNHLLTKHFSGLFLLKLMLSVVYMLLTLLIAFILRYDINQSKFLFILATNQFLTSIILYLRSNLSGLHLFKTDSIVSVLDRLIMIIICSIWLWGNVIETKMNILWFAYSQTIALAVTSIIAFIIVFNKAKSFKFSFNWAFNLMILKKSFPFAILVLLMTFYNRIDTVMLERLLKDGGEQSGIYAMAYRLLDSANMIAYLFSVILLPMFAKMIKHNESIEELAKLSFKLLIVPAIIVAVVSIFYAHDIMKLLYKYRIGEASDVFGILMCCFMATATTYVFGTLLTANGNLKYLNTMALGGMVLNIALNFILIPKYKVMGAACSSLITQFITAGIQMALAYKIFKFKTDPRMWVGLAIFVAGVFSFTYLNKIYLHNWILSVIVIGLLSGVWALITGLFKVKTILSYIKKPSFA